MHLAARIRRILAHDLVVDLLREVLDREHGANTRHP